MPMPVPAAFLEGRWGSRRVASPPLQRRPPLVNLLPLVQDAPAVGHQHLRVRFDRWGELRRVRRPI
eukprot:3657153-Pyramimonas_sp.AAC.1